MTTALASASLCATDPRMTSQYWIHTVMSSVDRFFEQSALFVSSHLVFVFILRCFISSLPAKRSPPPSLSEDPWLSITWQIPVNKLRPLLPWPQLHLLPPRHASPVWASRRRLLRRPSTAATAESRCAHARTTASTCLSILVSADDARRLEVGEPPGAACLTLLSFCRSEATPVQHLLEVFLSARLSAQAHGGAHGCACVPVLRLQQTLHAEELPQRAHAYAPRGAHLHLWRVSPCLHAPHAAGETRPSTSTPRPTQTQHQSHGAGRWWHGRSQRSGPRLLKCRI